MVSQALTGWGENSLPSTAQAPPPQPSLTPTPPRCLPGAPAHPAPAVPPSSGRAEQAVAFPCCSWFCASSQGSRFPHARIPRGSVALRNEGRRCPMLSPPSQACSPSRQLSDLLPEAWPTFHPPLTFRVRLGQGCWAKSLPSGFAPCWGPGASVSMETLASCALYPVSVFHP